MIRVPSFGLESIFYQLIEIGPLHMSDPKPKVQRGYANAVENGRKTTPVWLPPFTGVPAGTAYPEIPSEWRSMDPVLLGTPSPFPGPADAMNTKANEEKYMFASVWRTK